MGSTTNAAVPTQTLVEHWQKARPIVHNVLAKAGKTDEVDDVMQDLWVSLEHSIANYDPELGALGAWIGRIAHHRAVDHLTTSLRAHRLQDRIEHHVDHQFAVTAADAAHEVVEREYQRQVLSEVLSMTRETMDNLTAFERTMTLILKYDEKVKAAASSMGISDEALRASRRDTLRTAAVVRKALEAHRAGQEPTLRVLLGCLPDEQDEAVTGSGLWMKHMAHAAARSGGFANVTPTVLTEVTGWEYNTCRQYLNQTRDLLSVARTIVVYGAGRIHVGDE